MQCRESTVMSRVCAAIQTNDGFLCTAALWHTWYKVTAVPPHFSNHLRTFRPNIKRPIDLELPVCFTPPQVYSL